METRVLAESFSTFRSAKVKVTQVVLEDAEQLFVHCDFASEEEEREFLDTQPRLDRMERFDWMQHMGGHGMATIIERDSGSRLELHGSVRLLPRCCAV